MVNTLTGFIFNRKFEFAQNIDITLRNISQDGALLWKTDQRNDNWSSIYDVTNVLNFGYPLTFATLFWISDVP